MIVYNITCTVDASVADAWIGWQLGEHIPEILATGCFTAHRVLRLLEVDESEGPTFAIQYEAATMEDYRRYIDGPAAALRQKAFDRWGDRFLAFRTIMEKIG